jgi:hypothetical protein
MAASARRATTWNRDDRDLLVELRTQMASVRDEVAAARGEIKEINTGISARLLNLESNAVSRIELDGLDERIRVLEAATNSWLGKQSLIGGAFGIVAGLIGSFVSAGRL